MQTDANNPKINIPVLNAQAALLQAGTPPLYATSPLTGNTQNVLNAIRFYFPVAASQAGATIAAEVGFAANDAASSDVYNADNTDFIDPGKTFGIFLNTVTYGTLELGNTDVHVASGNQYTGIDGKTYTFQNILFTIAIIDARQSKNIIKTKITGRDGEIKEYIGMNDWAITISSVINMPVDQAPLQFLQAFLQMLTAQVSIPVKNYYLNALGISNIVIEDIDLGQAEGGYSSQPIKITACSDIPLTNFLP